MYYRDAAFTIAIKSFPWMDESVYADWDADGYRLPTEAEWEFAARYAGSGEFLPASWASGASADALNREATGRVGWFSANSGMHTQKVGLKEPNALGLYDMSGNVSELCWDYAAPLPPADRTDYRGGTNAERYRVARGGTCRFDSRYLATEIRDARSDVETERIYGLRLARSTP